jgi:hypothetical protein
VWVEPHTTGGNTPYNGRKHLPRSQRSSHQESVKPKFAELVAALALAKNYAMAVDSSGRQDSIGIVTSISVPGVQLLTRSSPPNSRALPHPPRPTPTVLKLGFIARPIPLPSSNILSDICPLAIAKETLALRACE